MVKRKDSASGVSVEDPTDKSEQNTDSYFFQPTRHDLLPIVLALVAIALGLTAGLLSYFLLQNAEQMNARNDLQVRLQTVKTQLLSATDSVTGVILNTASFFQVSKTPITLYDQFLPYMMSAGSFPKYLTLITYVDYVPINDTDAYVQQLRNSGQKEYANFTVTSRDANYRPIPALYTPVRCIIIQAVPTAFMTSLVGFDVCTDETRKDAVYNSYYTGKTAVSGGLVTNTSQPNSKVVVVVKNVNLNATSAAPAGAVYAAIVLNDMIRDALDAVLDGFDISIYDLNATTSERLLYSTATVESAGNGTRQDLRRIANAQYTFSTLTTFADRTLQITIIPNDAYHQKYNGTTKVVALSVSLVIMVVLLIGCVFLYFARKLFVAKKKRAEAHVQIDLLKTNQTALRTLLDRIASQESKTRAVINSLPDAVCVISPTGKILQTNSAFDNEFPFSQQEMEKGVYTWDVFTELSSDFFRVFDETKEIETQAARRFGDMVEVLLRVRDLRGKSGESSTSQSNEVKPSGMSSLQLQEVEEAYVIIAKNISIKHIVHETNTQERVQRHDFERKFRDKEFREELKQYCEKNKNVENILFLEQIKEYKKAQFGTRVDMKMAIFDRFIKVGAPMQLNLANEVVLEESIKINKSMGDVDVFRNVEECVLKTLANDIYPRYLMDQRKTSVADMSQ